MLRTACSLVFVCALAAPLSAQDAAFVVASAAPGAPTAPAPAAPLAPVAPVAPAPRAPTAPLAPLAPTPHRPPSLLPLYAGFATLQALDYASTTRALASGGAHEANPIMRSIVNSPPAFIAVKAAATAGVIVAGERCGRRTASLR